MTPFLSCTCDVENENDTNDELIIACMNPLQLPMSVTSKAFIDDIVEDDELNNNVNIHDWINPFKWYPEPHNFSICSSFCDEQKSRIEVPTDIKQLIVKYFDCSLSSYIHITPQRDITDDDKIIFSDTFIIDGNIKLKCAVILTMNNNHHKCIQFVCAVESMPMDISELIIQYQLCCRQTFTEYHDICTIKNDDAQYSSLDSFTISDKIFHHQCIDAFGWPSYYLSIDQQLENKQLVFGCDVHIISKK